ncbi:MAG: hypothetical protein IPM33_00340 [Phycisphaerales bacterium]|nr:hypothetical protein [Phycisphaerales bacterium]
MVRAAVSAGLLTNRRINRRATWPLQDAGGDVIALCDLAGVNASARVLTQIVYDAYGRVIGRDDPATPSTGPPELRVGHKGLFFDRLDAGIFDVTLGRETPRLAPGARLSGYARNRTLHCDFGRWNQADPNATGLPVQTAIAFHGEAPGAWVQSFDLGTHFGDGPNIYAYIGNSPLTRFDPAGTSMMEMMGSMGIRGMLAGALFGGVFGGIQGYQSGDVMGGIGRGMLVGAVGGAAGGMMAGVAQSAFAASAAGLMASIIQSTTLGYLAGYAGGFAGSLTNQAIDGRSVDWRTALADAATVAAWGGAIGGLGGGMSWMASTGSPQALALATSTTIRFGNNANQVSHAFRHTDALGLSRADVSQAVRSDLLINTGSIVSGSPFNQTISINGVRVQYTAYRLPDGVINVGRIHGVP